MKIGIAKYDFSAITTSGQETDIQKGDHMTILCEYEDYGYWFLDDVGNHMAETPWPAYEARLLSGLKVSAIHQDALEVID